MRALLTRLWWIGVGAGVAGCPDTSCPDGSMAVAGRCVAARDAGGDAYATPDACTLNAHYPDLDGDGHGAGEARLACPGPGLALTDDDCDDETRTRRPGGVEVCDGADDDCDGAIDEGLQTMVGTPFVLDEGAVPGWLDVAAVGSSYLVAWNAGGGLHARRYDRLGAPMGAAMLLSPQPSDGFVRVLARDATTAIIGFRTSDPPGLHVVSLDTETEPMTLGASTQIGDASTPLLVGLAWTDRLSVASVTTEEPWPVARAFDASLAPLGAAVQLDDVVARGVGLLPGTNGPLLVTSLETSVELRELQPDTFGRLTTGSAAGDGALAHLSAIDPRGVVHVLRIGLVDLLVTRFRRERIGEMESFRSDQFLLPVTSDPARNALPGLVAHDAGLDLAFVRNDGETASLQLVFVTTDDQLGFGSTSLRSTSMARGARLSSRDGAWFFVTVAGGAARLEMLRVGCE